MGGAFNQHILGSILAVLVAVTSVGPALAQPDAASFRPEFMSVRISPDGERVATVRPYQDRTALVVYHYDQPPAAGGEPSLVVPSGPGVNINAIEWVGPRTVFIIAGFAHQNVDNYRQIDRGAYGTYFMSLNISTGRLVTYDGLGYGTYVIHTLPRDPDNIMVMTYNNGWPRPALMRIQTGGLDHLGRGVPGTMGFAIDRLYNPRALTAFNPPNIDIRHREPGSIEWDRVHRYPVSDFGSASPYAVLGRVEEYLYLNSDHEGRVGLYRILVGERPGGMERVFLHDQFDMSGSGYLGSFGYSLNSGNTYYAGYIDGVYRRHYLRDRTREFDEAHNEALPGEYA